MIIITTMKELPNYCHDCPCNNGEYGRCEADEEKRSTFEYRPYWCPLKDIANEQERSVSSMPNRENVIKEAEEILAYVLPDEKDTSGIMVKVGWIRDVIALLKEHEAIEPIITPWRVNEDGEAIIAKRECGRCGCQFFTEKPNYCENCGVPILWEGR